MIIKGGRFSLDPGAAFGTTPRSVWSRYVQANDQYRIEMDTNLVLAVSGGKRILIDSGVGPIHNEKFAALFQVKPRSDLIQTIQNHSEGKLDIIVHSHLHFDHAGNSEQLLKLNRGAILLAQSSEKRELRRPNELTAVSYDSIARLNRDITGIDGSRRITSWLSVLHTGGHTAGHQSIVFRSGTRKFIYLGDLAPTPFNLKPARITGVDTYPLESLAWKKKLVAKAIRESMVCIFNHDTSVPAATVSGTVEKPEFTPFDLVTY